MKPPTRAVSDAVGPTRSWTKGAGTAGRRPRKGRARPDPSRARHRSDRVRLEMEERAAACDQAGERVEIADHGVDRPGRHASIAAAPSWAVTGCGGQANSG